MGVDSCAILLRWLTDPTSRNFELDDLAVVTAQTGDEKATARTEIEKLVLPLMRAHRIRLIQVARSDRYATSTGKGIVVLSDTRSPDRMFTEGRYKLSDEMLSAGTVPQAGGARLCSVHAKGDCLDPVIERITRGRPYRHVLGFELHEQSRALKDTRFNTALRTGEYPLIDWQWTRQDCQDFIVDVVGEPISKSACVYCPFALSNKTSRIEALQRYAERPDEAALALTMEHVALALNANQGLIAGKRLIDLLASSGQHHHVLTAFTDELDRTEHALYRVRRILRPSKSDPTKMANAARAVERIATGSRGTMLTRLTRDYGSDVEVDGLITRAYLRRRGDQFPTLEELYTVAPAVVADKQHRNFDHWWSDPAHALEAPAAA
ncbi:hypothetical protein MX572_25715 (plasmid) [Rhodococcus pyridinivorans]|uniref:hypothetical protein n=1 Tax=Rhodococcus pyridinivorans TaxID=103816 RepID=UPI0020C74046|nr:hypothetical protein [Rhodococcus pyridinivorans]UTM40047.1 hypothetical protein MX572_25715 [Rhodococcus pyridinivorans]